MKNKTKSIVWLFIIALVFIIMCFIAFKVPTFCVECFNDQFSEKTGYIGDTIGGTVTPYLTAITALLALVALGVQFISFQQQALDLKIERHDNKFYNMLGVYQSNASRLEAGEKKGKDAAEDLAGEYFCIYTLIYSIYQEEYKNLLTSQRIDPVLLSKINLFLQSLNEDINKKKHFIAQLSYGLFYYGWNYTYPYEASTDEIFHFVEIVKERLKAITYVKDQSMQYSTWLHMEDALCNTTEYKANYPICKGHNDILGCYYRQMYQIAKIVAKTENDVYDENSKCDHMRILRSQMSDYEQMLLFFNSASDFGSKWNESKVVIKCPEDMGYISRFRMIKNIPANVYWRGLFPTDLFSRENQYWNSKGRVLFERSQLLQVDES